jgi:16S rRNA (adenine1518-N6/adenine1519-N6)-dimethyltransferase
MHKPHRPKLGQHFLADTHYRSRIVHALGLRAGDLVVEIGPGHGAMTVLLAAQVRLVAAVEVDPVLARELEQKFQQEPKVHIVNADILATDVAAIRRRFEARQCFVFGNLPYYITSPILHHLLEFAGSIRAMGLLVQREVANRLAARPGTRDYGYLTVLAGLYASPRVVFQVPPGAFSPPPKVHSALVYFEMHSPDARIGQKEEFRTFLKQCFSHKRKKLLNCLAEAFPRVRIEQEFERLSVPSKVRAEELSLEDFIALFSRLASGNSPGGA